MQLSLQMIKLIRNNLNGIDDLSCPEQRRGKPETKIEKKHGWRKKRKNVSGEKLKIEVAFLSDSS